MKMTDGSFRKWRNATDYDITLTNVVENGSRVVIIKSGIKTYFETQYENISLKWSSDILQIAKTFNPFL